MSADELSAPRVREAIHRELDRVYIGPARVVDLLLTALLAPGHVLLEGVPGVAKTTLAKAFSATLGCDFRRIQFTPDMLPADITGSYILNLRDNSFVLRRGPIFAHVVLGDEINRAPAKTQSALLEAMQERQVTIEGETLALPDPFVVLATQNPLEQEGVYPLPEAQVDRFMMKLVMGYPSAGDELKMLATYDHPRAPVAAVLDPEAVRRLRAAAGAVHVSGEVQSYIVALARFTREHPRVRLGASPRASLSLMRAAKAAALLGGREFVLPDDIRGLAEPVLAHRLVMTPEAELDGVGGSDVVREAVSRVSYRGPADR
ncbi:MAG: MoxR family ATPase [Myxococcales bacterium]|nr:MoxR family ATPase [Myxococcales bacterium]MCB9552313.1 MoxR family ATPase [Myxococcales bacterium]